MSYLYHAFFFNPLYNLLIALFDAFPWIDAGLAVIILTIIVRLILYPLSRKAVLTQLKMNSIAPDIARIKAKHPNSSEAQAKETLALYKEKGVNPFSGIFVILIQIPLIFALYRIFLQLPAVDASLLYSFISAPAEVSTLFLGFLDVSSKSIVLALLAAVSTFLQLYFSAQNQVAAPGAKGSFGEGLAKSMQTQMKYLFPIMVFFISYNISAVIALYWLTTNLFSLGQEYVIKRNAVLV